MPEPTPMPTAAPMRAEDSYRPISGLAIASLTLGGLFALVLLANASVGLVKGMPFFLSSWLLLLPIGGAVLSFVAQYQIRNSEDTRAGVALAKWGMWLSVLFGLGYVAYDMTTNFAVRRQAEEFLLDPDQGFFAKLKRPREANAAFLLTRPPELREDLNPSNDELMHKQFSRDLPRFLENSLVRIVQQGGQDTDITLSKVKDPIYLKGGYWVVVTATITTQDLEDVQFPLTVRSKDSRNGREWYVDWTQASEAPIRGNPTERGASLMGLRLSSHQAVIDWLQRLKAGKVTKTDLVPQGASLDLEGVRDLKLRKQVAEGFRLLSDPTTDPRPKIMETIKCCRLDSSRGMQPTPLLAKYGINKKNNRLQVTHEILLMMWVEANAMMPKVGCLARITVERADGGGLAARPSSWRVVRLEITEASDPSERGRR